MSSFKINLFYISFRWKYSTGRSVHKLPSTPAKITVCVRSYIGLRHIRCVHYILYKGILVAQLKAQYTKYLFCQFCPFVRTQSLLDLFLVISAMVIICGVLIALQFPVVMSSPVAALAFAFVTTASLGTVATLVGGVVAPLPLFALILVSSKLKSLYVFAEYIFNLFYIYNREYIRCYQFPGQCPLYWPFFYQSYTLATE